MDLAQSGYPNPKDYQSNEKLIIDYTFATGGTAKIKELLSILEEQYGVIESLKQLQKQNEQGPAI